MKSSCIGGAASAIAWQMIPDSAMLPPPPPPSPTIPYMSPKKREFPVLLVYPVEHGTRRRRTEVQWCHYGTWQKKFKKIQSDTVAQRRDLCAPVRLAGIKSWTKAEEWKLSPWPCVSLDTTPHIRRKSKIFFWWECSEFSSSQRGLTQQADGVVRCHPVEWISR